MTGWGPAGLIEEARRRRVFQIAAVYIVGAFVALQVADLAFPGLSIPESAMRYVWIGAIIGFPFALFFGWRYDFIDGRILRTAAVDGQLGAAIGRGDKATLTIMTLALLAICTGLAIEISRTQVDGPGRPRLENAAPNSLAVLPFANFGGAQENEYLADGITETLLHALAQASALKVTARTSSFFYKGRDIDVRDIANELGVSKILEGSVQQSGDKIRIVAQLIEADTGFHLWSNTYDQDLGEVFSIQDSIASNVAIAILATMTAAPGLSDTQLTGVSTTNLEAYQLYLRGLEQARISTNVSLPKAELFFQQALAADPDFHEAKQELAVARYVMLNNGTLPVKTALDRLSLSRDEMLQSQPDDGVTIFVDAAYRYYQDPYAFDVEDFELAVAKLKTAIDRQPNDVRIYRFLAFTLNAFGQRDEAIKWTNRALVIDPLDYNLYWNLGGSYQGRKEYAAAIEAYRKVTELNPEYAGGHSSLAWAEFNAGNPVVWYQEFLIAAALDPLDHEMEVGTAQGLMRLGLYEESSKHAARASEINVANGGEWQINSLLSLLGDPAEARSLNQAFLRRDLTGRGTGITLYNPLMAYVSASIDAGAAQDALTFIEEVFPGTTADEFVPDSRIEFYLQFWATVAWAHGKDTSEVVARLDALAPRWKATAPNPARTYERHVVEAFLRGDMEETSRIALEHLIDSSGYLLFMYQYVYPLNIVAEHPTVAARLAEIEEEIRPRREALRAYIAENN